MNTASDKAYIEQLIASQRSAIKYYGLFAAGVVLLGVVLIIASFLFFSSSQGPTQTIITIGGGFISTLSTFQIKEVIGRNEKINVFRNLQMRLEMIDSQDSEGSEAERERVKELLWGITEKIVTR